MMQDYFLWISVGLVLVIVEVMTGTFYLLVLGVAAFVGALAAYFGFNTLAQVICTGMTAALGLFLVHRWHQTRPEQSQRDRSLDVGQAVTFESWVDQNARRVRVKYRGASWDAELIGDASPQFNDTLYISGTQGSQLQVSRTIPNP